MDNTGQDESIDEGEDEEYFNDFEENDYMEEEEDFQGFGDGDAFGLENTGEDEEEDNLQSLLPLFSSQPSMVIGKITSQIHCGIVCVRFTIHM